MSQAGENEQVVTTGVAARMLGGVSATTVRAMCERGELEGAYQVGSWWRIPIVAIEKIKGHGRAEAANGSR